DFFGARANLGEGALYGVVAFEIELHAAHVGLVGDGVRVNLDHHRVAQVIGCGDSLLGVLRHARLHGGNAVGSQQPLRFVLVEQVPSGAACSVDDAGGRLPVDGLALG